MKNRLVIFGTISEEDMLILSSEIVCPLCQRILEVGWQSPHPKIHQVFEETCLSVEDTLLCEYPGHQCLVEKTTGVFAI